MSTAKSGTSCKDGEHLQKHMKDKRTNICNMETCMKDSTICGQHYQHNLDNIPWLKWGNDWRNKKVRELKLDPTNPILLTRPIDPEIINNCEEIKQHFQTQHEKIMSNSTLPELEAAETNAISETSGTTLISKSNFENANNEQIIDRRGRIAGLNIALLAGNNGNPVLAAFDSGATRTTIRLDAAQGPNSKIKLLKLGPDTATQGVGSIRVPSQHAEIEIPTQMNKNGYFRIDVLVQETIVITQEKCPPETLLNYCVDKLQGIEGYEKTTINNFQQLLGGNVDILIGEDLSDLHPDEIGTIYDGFKIVHHKAKLYNPNQFLLSLIHI